MKDNPKIDVVAEQAADWLPDLSDRRAGGDRNGKVDSARLRREGADGRDCADHRDHVRKRQAADAQLDQANSSHFIRRRGRGLKSASPAAR